ncbi:hypothetical protein B0192_19135 [Leptospira interrogans serovar Australis]|nr:hypothetical protein B0192_19135 [Leptospira interrogans serovar Australis]
MRVFLLLLLKINAKYLKSACIFRKISRLRTAKGRNRLKAKYFFQCDFSIFRKNVPEIVN